MPIFTPPTVSDSPAVLARTRGVQRSLFRYYGGNPRGLSVLRSGATYVLQENPSSDMLDLAGGRDGTDFFLGGHTYTITAAQATALTAAGFGAYIT